MLHFRSLINIPSRVSTEDACFLFCTAAVALRGLRTIGDFFPGQSVLVTGSTGGVGIHAIQLAKALGAENVVAITSSPEKKKILYDLGADQVIVSSKERPFHTQVLFSSLLFNIIIIISLSHLFSWGCFFSCEVRSTSFWSVLAARQFPIPFVACVHLGLLL